MHANYPGIDAEHYNKSSVPALMKHFQRSADFRLLEYRFVCFNGGNAALLMRVAE